jgi:hypothetical protein
VANNPLQFDQTDPSSAEAIRAAARVEAIFADAENNAAIRAVEKLFVEEMISAKTAEERARAQSKVIVFRAMISGLAALVEQGVKAVLSADAEKRRHEFLKREGLVQ